MMPQSAFKDLGPLAINLASQPFRRERAQNAGFAVACAALTCSLLVLLGLILHARAQAHEIRADIDSERAELQRLQAQQSQFSAVLARPRNADIFAHSVFLNELIARRAVSWTKVFEDLQTVMPANMRLQTIRLPQVPAMGAGNVNRVHLDMTLNAEKPESLIELLQKLGASPLFGSATVVSQTPPTQNDNFYRYRVTVAYAQKL
jgi:type IV pilus assembly protein PilN